jgi:C-methyltransferase-like protein/putative zinc binding protein/methyltransferase family protein
MTAAGSRDDVSRIHDRCRVCGSSGMVRYLDMGATPLANSYLTVQALDQPEPVSELALQICVKCGLSQLTRVVDRDLMFRNYLYVSSTTQTFRDHCAELAATAMKTAAAAPGDWALDIASNDGLLLSCFKSLGMRVVGVDPARNLAAEAAARGIPTVAEYWSPSIARNVVESYGRPKTITATNVLAHVDDVHEFAEAVEIALDPHGILVVEVPYVIDFIERDEFDTAYHEHLSYFGLHPIRELLRAHDLDVFDVSHFPDIHGGTIRVFASRTATRPSSSRVTAMLDRERAFGMTESANYVAFGERVRQNMSELAHLLKTLRSEGKRIWAYGASAKGNTLMNFSGMKAETIPMVVDDNPKKWGLYTPGARMRIVGPAELAAGEVDHLLLLAWNFESEIVKRSRAAGYRGSYVRPVPAVAVFD